MEVAKSTLLALSIFLLPALASAQSNDCYEVKQSDTLYKTSCPDMEQQPEFPGGIEGLMTFIKKNIHYPGLAKKLGISGKVFITFVVEKNGAVTNVEVQKGAPQVDAPTPKKQKKYDQAVQQLNDEAKRVITILPDFSKPGMQLGKPVRVKYFIPIKFTLSR